VDGEFDAVELGLAEIDADGVLEAEADPLTG
jgi:hypothetical protein